jgi:capsid protein
VDVWEAIESLFGDLENLENQLRIAQQQEFAALDPKREELRAVDAMIAQAEADAVEIGQALRQATGLVAKSLKQNMDEVNLRYEALSERHKVLQSEVTETKLTNTAIEGLVQFAQDVFVGIKEADFQTKRRNLEVLRVRVVVDGGKFTIESLAGKITGEIRKLPIVRKPGDGSVTNSR